MTREQALVFGEVADDYERIRPGYPAVIFDAVVDASPGPRVVEVGAGTGRATLEFVRRNCAVVAVEPSTEMAEVLRRTLAEQPGTAPAVEIVATTFEAYAAGAAPGGADVIAAFQAWHWVNPANGYPAAARLVRPGGALALCWNHPRPIDPDLRRALDAVYERNAPALTVREMGSKGRDVDRADGPLRTRAAAWFGGIDVVTEDWTTSSTAVDYATLLATQSDHRLLPEDIRERLLADIVTVVEAAGGRIDLPYTTRLVLARRLS